MLPLQHLCGSYGERNRGAFEGVEKDFVHLRNTLYFLISFSCNHNIPTCKHMSACKVLYVFAILLVFAQAFALSFMKFIT